MFADLIGAEFETGGRGPERFDCYGLLREMYRRQHALEIPTYITYETRAQNQALIGTFAQNDWQPCEKAPGVAVVFYIGRYASHIGFVLENDRFIHAWESSGGVTVERLSDWQHRIAGFYDFRR